MALEKLCENLNLSEISKLQFLLETSIIEKKSCTDLLHQISTAPISLFFTLSIYHSASKAACTLLDDLTLIILSFSGEFTTININTLETSTQTIESKPQRLNFTCCKISDKLFIFGGKSPEGEIFGELLIFDLSEKMWVECEQEQVVEPRHSHCAAIAGDLMIIYAGIGTKGFLRDLYTLDINTMVWEQIQTEGYVSKSQKSMVGHFINNDFYVISRFLHEGRCGNQIMKVKLHNYSARITGEVLGNEEAFEEILGVNSVGHFLVIVGIIGGNIAGKAYQYVLDYWKTLEVVDYRQSKDIIAEVVFLPFVYNNQVFVARFYENGVINIG